MIDIPQNPINSNRVKMKESTLNLVRELKKLLNEVTVISVVIGILGTVFISLERKLGDVGEYEK